MVCGATRRPMTLPVLPPGWLLSPEACCPAYGIPKCWQQDGPPSTLQRSNTNDSRRPPARWHGTPESPSACRPLPTIRELVRADQVPLHRLWLGYRTREELSDEFEGRQCGHCGLVTDTPLVHYLLSCPATAGLRPQHFDAPHDDEAAAALVLRQALSDLPQTLEVVRTAPPPR